MSEKIIKPLSQGFVLRMRCWARFMEGRGTALPSCLAMEGGGDGDQGSPSMLLGVVHDVEMALAALPLRYGQVVKQFWWFEGRPLRWHGRHRGIDYHTFEVWVVKGHELLKAEFRVARERWHQQVAEAQANLPPELQQRIRVHSAALEHRDIA